MKSHGATSSALSALTALCLTIGAVSSSAIAADAAPQSPQDLLRQMAPLASDDCSPPYSSDPTIDVDHAEELLFENVDTLVTDELNKPTPAQAADAESRARSALREVEQSSSEINKSWPTEDRFHFEIMTLHPAVLIRMFYRGHAKLVLFGSYDSGNYSSDAGTKWHAVYLDGPDPSSRASSGIELFPLHRGPTGRARFLARVWYSGCAGSIGEAYYGYEWTPEDGDLAAQIIKIEGAEGLGGDSKEVGKLSTHGKIIQLPYCYFSAVDTWDNPTLCAADSFDMSGDAPRFINRVYNSPDLVVVNNVIQHAQARDYVAVRGYCASDAVARKLVREIPPYLFVDDLKVVKLGSTRETVIFEGGPVYFDLAKRRGEWLLQNVKFADKQ